MGFELGTRIQIGKGSVRPIAALAAPVFFADGVLLAGRAEVGLAVSIRRFDVVIGIGAAYSPFLPDHFDSIVALGSVGLELNL